jgi:hypothetical protein
VNIKEGSSIASNVDGLDLIWAEIS